jgi:hypothetical protein
MVLKRRLMFRIAAPVALGVARWLLRQMLPLVFALMVVTPVTALSRIWDRNGFPGLLTAIPLAAAIGGLVSFASRRDLASPFSIGEPAPRLS